MAAISGAWERRVRDLTEIVMSPDLPLRQDVLDFLRCGEAALAVETLADWIGELEDTSVVSRAHRFELIDLSSGFSEETRDRVAKAVAE